MRFFKFEGTGNDFLIADRNEAGEMARVLPSHARPQAVRRLCDRHFGVGADGVVFFSAGDPKGQLTWDFYNDDGSAAEMCGNAARCVGAYAAEFLKWSGPVQLQTGAGGVRLEARAGGQVEVTMPPIACCERDRSLQFDQREFLYDWIDSGVPHAVFHRPHFNDLIELESLAAQWRRRPVFPPPGANITFVHRLEEDRLETVSYERGVNALTLSCGTGAVAAAQSLALRAPEVPQWRVDVRGGSLRVDLRADRPHLLGPANFVAEMRIEL